MFDRVSEAAEKLATNVSRRAFMGGLGKVALAVAGALGFAGAAQAGGGKTCCVYGRWHGRYTKCVNDACPPPQPGFKLVGAYSVATCSQC
jgi:hypothetical protein